MSKKFPQSSYAGDEKAYQYLRRLFTEDNWKFFEIREVFSGTEFGDDYIIRVVDESGLRDAQFCIQNKTFNTKKQVKGKRLRTKIKISTLNFLAEQNIPVVLHYLDTVNDKGYWIWLDHWYQNNYKEAWNDKKEINVPVPKENNELDFNAVNEIRKRVLWEHKQQILAKRANIESKINPNFKFISTIEENIVSIAVSAKHEKAFEKNPIGGTFLVSSDEEEKIQYAIETGEIVKLQANVQLTGLPEWMIEDIPENASFDIHLKTNTMSNSSLQIEFRDENKNSISSFFADFKQTKNGTRFNQWEGKPKQYPIIALLTLDLKTKKISINFRYNKSKKPKELVVFFEFSELLKDTKSLVITNIETEVSHEVAIEKSDIGILAIANAYTVQVVRALANLNVHFNLDLEIPIDDASKQELETILAIDEVIETGQTSRLSTYPTVQKDDESVVIIAVVKRKEVAKFVEDVSKTHYIQMHPTPIPFHFDVLGQKITLEGQQIVYLAGIDDSDWYKNQLNSDNESIQIPYFFDRKKSYLYFPEFDNYSTDEN